MPANKKLTWLQLQIEIKQADTEGAVTRILENELAVANRPSFVRRIYGKYSKLRRERELKEM